MYREGHGEYCPEVHFRLIEPYCAVSQTSVKQILVHFSVQRLNVQSTLSRIELFSTLGEDTNLIFWIFIHEDKNGFEETIQKEVGAKRNLLVMHILACLS